MSGNIDDKASQKIEPIIPELPSAYIPQEKTVLTDFCVIMFVYYLPSKEGKTIDEGTSALLQLAHPSIDTSLFALTYNSQNDSKYGYHQSISNDGSYYLIPLEENQELDFFVLFGFDQGSAIQICSRDDFFYGSSEQIVTNSPYTFHYILCNIASLDDYSNFTITDTYLDITNLPIPDISDYPVTTIPVSKNTIVIANDTNQSYVYTDNGWQLFANNAENITDEETELFIRGLIYHENIEDDSSGSDDGSGGQEK